MHPYAQGCTRRTHTVSCGWTNVHDMLRNEPHLQIQRISTSKPLHAPCSAMRLMDDTRERCNQKTTYIMSCAWDHAHDVMRQEPEQCFTVVILLHDSTWWYTMDSHRSTSCRTHEIMRINECVVEHRTVQHVNQLFYIIHVALILFVLWYGAMFDSYNPDCFWTMDRLKRRSSSCFASKL